MRLGDLTRWIGRSSRPAPVAPSRSPAEVEASDGRRSVVFFKHAYYNFFYLAKALRRRGWDALSVNPEAPDGPSSQYYHGEDINLFDPDPVRNRQNQEAFFEEVKRRVRMLQFYGRGHMSLFESSYDQDPSHSTVPIDFMALRDAGVKIGYTTN